MPRTPATKTADPTTDDVDAAPSTSSTSSAPKDKPPAKPRGGARPGAGRPRSGPTLAAQCTGLLQQLGGGMVAFGMATGSATTFYDGSVIADRAEAVGDALGQLAASNPAIRRALESLFKASSWSQLLITTAQVAIPIAACHGLIPAHPMIVGPFVSTTVGMPPPRNPRPTPVPDTVDNGDGAGLIIGPDGTPIVLNFETNGHG